MNVNVTSERLETHPGSFSASYPAACWERLRDCELETECVGTEKLVHELKHRLFLWLYHLFQFEKLEGIPELGVIMEQAEGESDRDDRLCLPQTPGDVPNTGPFIPLPSPERHLQHQRQVLTHLLLLAECYHDKIRKNSLSSLFSVHWSVKYIFIKIDPYILNVAQLQGGLWTASPQNFIQIHL